MARPRLSEEDTEAVDRRHLVARDYAFQAALLEQIDAGTELAKSMRDVVRPRYTLAAPHLDFGAAPKANPSSPWRK